MRIIDAGQVERALAFPALIAALEQGFRQDFGMPQRQVFALAPDSASHDGFAVLPAWNEDVIGLKAFTYFPDNGSAGYPTLHSQILLFSRAHGVPLALIDGTSVTYWRTAAVSALAARYLARADSASLLLLGTGQLAAPLVAAHLAEHRLQQVFLWGRRPDAVAALQARLENQHPQVRFEAVGDLAACAARADIIVSATGSATPLLQGAWLTPGCHVDLLGNHSPDRRECDSALVQRSAVYVDSRQNVLNEAGELLIPIREGVFGADAVRGELAELCRGTVPARQSAEQITLFKSVGTALSDLIAAHLVLKQLSQ